MGDASPPSGIGGGCWNGALLLEVEAGGAWYRLPLVYPTRSGQWTAIATAIPTTTIPTTTIFTPTVFSPTVSATNTAAAAPLAATATARTPDHAQGLPGQGHTLEGPTLNLSHSQSHPQTTLTHLAGDASGGGQPPQSFEQNTVGERKPPSFENNTGGGRRPQSPEQNTGGARVNPSTSRYGQKRAAQPLPPLLLQLVVRPLLGSEVGDDMSTPEGNTGGCNTGGGNTGGGVHGFVVTLRSLLEMRNETPAPLAARLLARRGAYYYIHIYNITFPPHI